MTDNRPIRLQNGEAYLFCDACGARLWSFDGKKDASRSCPYQKYDDNGRKVCKTDGEN